jgi:hypothetical protein
MDIDTLLLVILIPVDIMLFSVLIAGAITFRKTIDFEKMINNQLNNNR